MLIVIVLDKHVPDKVRDVASWRLGLDVVSGGLFGMDAGRMASILPLEVLDINSLVKCIRMANVPRSIVELRRELTVNSLRREFTFNSTSTDPNEVHKWATLVEKNCDYKVFCGGANNIVYASITPGTIIEGMSEEDSVRSLIPSWLL